MGTANVHKDQRGPLVFSKAQIYICSRYYLRPYGLPSLFEKFLSYGPQMLAFLF